MNWLKKIITTYNKGLEYDKLQKSNDALRMAAKDFSDLYVEAEEQVTALKSQLEAKKLLEEGKYLPVSLPIALEELEQALPKQQRKHIIDGKHKPKKHLHEAFTYNPEGKVPEWCAKVQQKYNPNTPQEVVEAVSKYFFRDVSVRYKQDKGEYWQRPDEAIESLENNSGVDCEDVAILMHVMITKLLRDNWFDEDVKRLLFVFSNTYVEWHAYNVWMHHDGFFYVIESTIDPSNTFFEKWLHTPIAHDSMYHSFYGFAREDRSYIGTNLLKRRYGA